MAEITGGVWPAVCTALNEDGELNSQMQDKLVELFIEQQLDGLYVLGSTGQGPALSVETRKKIAERIIKTNAGRLPVVIHVGAVSTDDAIDLARHAADCGADGISSVPPIYWAADVELTFEHYRRVASATDRPFYLYHAAFLGLAAPPIKEYARRVEEIPNAAGMKITDPKLHTITLMRKHLDDRLIIFSGFDETMCQASISGANGSIGTWMNVFGPALKKVRNEFEAGNIDLAQRFTTTFSDLSEWAIFDRPARFQPFMRRAMQIKYGIDVGRARSPMENDLVTIDDADVHRLIDLIDGCAGVRQEDHAGTGAR